jgi:hypothetical protein
LERADGDSPAAAEAQYRAREDAFSSKILALARGSASDSDRLAANYGQSETG